MSSPESEDTPRPDATEPTPGAAGSAVPPAQPMRPEDVDAAFAAIVAGWAAEGAPRWPDAEDAAAAGTPEGARPAGSTDTDGPTSGVGLATPPGGAPRADPDPAREGSGGRDAPWGPRDHTPPVDEAHFVPPEPPPLPRVGVSSLMGLLLLVAGVVLLAVPGLVGGSIGVGIVPGLLAMTAGLGWLVFGLRRNGDRDGGPDGDGVV